MNTIDANITVSDTILEAEVCDTTAPFARDRGTERLTHRKRFTNVHSTLKLEDESVIEWDEIMREIHFGYYPAVVSNDNVENHAKSKKHVEKRKIAFASELRLESIRTAIAKSMKIDVILNIIIFDNCRATSTVNFSLCFIPFDNNIARKLEEVVDSTNEVRHRRSHFYF